MHRGVEADQLYCEGRGPPTHTVPTDQVVMKRDGTRAVGKPYRSWAKKDFDAFEKEIRGDGSSLALSRSPGLSNASRPSGPVRKGGGGGRYHGSWWRKEKFEHDCII